MTSFFLRQQTASDRKRSEEANKTAGLNNPPLEGGSVILVLLFIFLSLSYYFCLILLIRSLAC
jgi:hypothetical protein